MSAVSKVRLPGGSVVGAPAAPTAFLPWRHTLFAVVLFVLNLALTAPAWAQNRAVDTDGAIDLKGAVVLPSKLAVLLLVLAMVLVCLVGALLAQRSQERRAADETRRRLEDRLASQHEELTRLREPASQRETEGGEALGDQSAHVKSRAAST